MACLLGKVPLTRRISAKKFRRTRLLRNLIGILGPVFLSASVLAQQTKVLAPIGLSARRPLTQESGRKRPCPAPWSAVLCDLVHPVVHGHRPVFQETISELRREAAHQFHRPSQAQSFQAINHIDPACISSQGAQVLSARAVERTLFFSRQRACSSGEQKIQDLECVVVKTQVRGKQA